MPTQFDVIVNRQAGTVLRMGTSAVSQGLQTAFQEQLNDIVYADAPNLQQAVSRWLKDNANTNSQLVIGGGDGTILTATSEIINYDSEVALGILPLGTTNQSSFNLGFSKDFIEAAKQLRKSHAVRLPVGRINGSYFLLAASLDTNTTETFHAREALRRGEFLTALEKVLLTSLDVLTSREQTLSVSTPKTPNTQCTGSFILAVTPQPAHLGANRAEGLKRRLLHGITTSRKVPEAGAISLHFCKNLVGNAIGITDHLLRGRWLDHPSVTTLSDSEVVVSPLNSTADNQQTEISVDGEVKKTTYPIRISHHERTAKFLAPDCN